MLNKTLFLLIILLLLFFNFADPAAAERKSYKPPLEKYIKINLNYHKFPPKKFLEILLGHKPAPRPPKPTPHATPTPIAIPLPTVIPWPTIILRPTAIPTQTPVPTSIPGPTTMPTPTATPTPTAAPTNTPAPTAKPTEIPTPTPTTIPTSIPTAIPTPTATPTPAPQPNQEFREPLISITFDDGRISQYTTAWPKMKDYGLRGTFYITTGDTNKVVLDGVWAMTPENVNSLYTEGNEIGSHSVTHQDLTTLTPEVLEYELTYSKSYLENLIKAPVKNFALPNGAYNDTVNEKIKQYYTSNRTYFPDGDNTKKDFNSNGIRDVGTRNTTTVNDITAWIEKAKTEKSWLIITYHSVEANPDAYSTTPENFESHLQAIKNSGIRVTTIDQSVNEILPQL